MGKINQPILAFNRGIISERGLSRIDIEQHVLFAGETQTNWMPRVLGSMMLRPGTGYIGTTRSSSKAVHLPFVFASDDTAIIELTNLAMRIRLSETIISRPAVTSTIANGTFDSNLTSWTDDDDSGATSAWATGGYMSLIGTVFNAAKRYQQVTVGANANIEHALHIVINRGPVVIKVGTTNGGEQYIAATTLNTGVHSLAFTPAVDFYIQFSNKRQAASLVDSVAIEASGDMVVATPWTEANLGLIRYDESNDVIFCATKGYQQRRIERHADRSWSVVVYAPENGPFRLPNITPISLTPSALTGDITLTASDSFFKSTHVGALFKITSTGQKVSSSVTAENQFSDPIRVIGAGITQRSFSLVISGTWVATVTLQRSTDLITWVDVTNYAANTSTSYNDALDNQTLYYRLGVKAGDFTSGTVAIDLSYTSGGIVGICRITAYSSATSVSAGVLVPLGAITASTIWQEGAWSDYRGWPSAVSLVESRLGWAGIGSLWISASDAFEDYDDDEEGDSAPILKTLGAGPIDTANWLLPLQRLVIGTALSEKSARTSSLDEPLTATNCTVKDASTQGSARVAAVRVDNRGIFLQQSTFRVYEISYNGNGLFTSFDYDAVDLTGYVPDIGRPGFIKIAIQRQPDTRLHCVRSDGTVAILINDPTENVLCWVEYETDGVVEDVLIMPGTEESLVYYTVKRTINGSTVRYLEKWALESECEGGTLNKQVDSGILYSGVSTATITGLSTLEGEQVVVWGNGVDLSPDVDGVQTTYTVTSGQISLPSQVTSAIIGLPYTAQFKSTKLAYAAQFGTALTQKKKVNYLGLNLYQTHYNGVKYGPDFDNLDSLPLYEDGTTVAANYIWPTYDKAGFEFDGSYDVDSRLCLQAQAPRPCTVTGVVITMQTNEKI